jgi:hypothetical protein
VAISNGKYRSQIYENKYKVDHYMKEQGVEGPYFYTGNFFENSVLRGHVKVGQNGDLEFKQPVILGDTKRMLSISFPRSSASELRVSCHVVC